MSTSRIQPALTRRQFLKSNLTVALAASAFPNLVPARVLGRDGGVAPSERVVLGAVGVGERGQAVLGNFLAQKDCQVVALCDVKTDVLARAKALVDGRYLNRDCATEKDFRALVSRPDLDAVLVASTDHWHVLHALAAVRSGKDVYVEKPLGLTLAESQVLRREVKQRKRVFQFGTQQRSDAKFRLACELVRNGRIGRLTSVNIWAPGSAFGGSTRVVPPPATVDYDAWLGPAPVTPHTEDLLSFDGGRKTWWFHSNFAVGFIAGWGIHPMDIALWGAGGQASGRVEIEGSGFYPREGLCNTATTWDLGFRFGTGLSFRFVGVPNLSPGEIFPQEREWKERYGSITSHGTAFEGTEGWVRVHRGSLAAHPEALLEADSAGFKTRLLRSSDHAGDFIRAVKTRGPTVAPIDEAVRADAFCHVADIAARLGRRLVYDVRGETFVGDVEANRRLALRPMRAPWHV